MKFLWVDEFLKLHEELMGLYRRAQNFDGGNFDVFDAFQLDRQYLTRQIV